MLEKAHMLGPHMTIRWTVKDKVLLALYTSKQLANQATHNYVNIFCPMVCVYLQLKTMTTCSESAD